MTKTFVVALAILLCRGAAVAQDSGAVDQMKPSPWREQFPSRRIELLRNEIVSGHASTELFWQAVTREGTPIVEPSKDGDQHQLVTFLWRGSSQTTSVLIVIDPFTYARPQDYLMRRLEDSDVWYLTVRMPKGARFIYRVSLNDRLDPGFLGDLKLGPEVAADPLNLHPRLGQSAVELPGAPPQPWVVRRSGTPEGRIEQHRITSTILSNERDIWVYTPPRYQPTASPYALLVLFDGSATIQRLSVPAILDNLIEASRIPATVAVFVSHPGESRPDELGEDPRFGNFLTTELIPWLRDHYNVTRNARDTVVGGQSAGGAAAAYVAFRHSDIFGGVLSQSGDFYSSPELRRDLAERRPSSGRDDDRHVLEEMEDRAVREGNWLPGQFIRSSRLSLRFYMNAGAFEAEFWGGPGRVAGILESNRHMRDVLLAKGYEVHYQEFVGGHDYLSWRGLLADGLIALFGKH